MKNTYQIALSADDQKCIERHLLSEQPGLALSGLRDAQNLTLGSLALRRIGQHKLIVTEELLALLNAMKRITEKGQHRRVFLLALDIQKQACEQGLLAWHFVFQESENFGSI